MYSEDIQDELTKIQNLLSSCFISQDEYNRRKSEILGTPVSNGNSGNPPSQQQQQQQQQQQNQYQSYDYNSSSSYDVSSYSNSDLQNSYNTSYFGGSTTSYTNNYSLDNYQEKEIEIPVIETLSISNNNININNNNNNSNNKNYNNNRYNNSNSGGGGYKYKYNIKKEEPSVENQKTGAFASMFMNEKKEEPKAEKPGAFASMFINDKSTQNDEDDEDEEDFMDEDEEENANQTSRKFNPVGDPRVDLQYLHAPYVVFKPLDQNSKKVSIDLTNWIKERKFSVDLSLNQSVDNWKADKIKEQNNLRSKIIYENVKKLSIKASNCNIKLIGGCDISFPKDKKIDAVASIVVLEYPSLKVVYESYKMVKLTEPYVAGYLAFREVPHFLQLWETLVQKYPQFKPDVMILDGNGINHQRSVGAATHFGILANVPTIGVAKNLLVAKGITPEYISNGFKNSNAVEMIDYQDAGRKIGFAMYNKKKEIIYISPGHMIDANTALEIVEKTLGNRPIPEATFQADHLSRLFIKLYYNKL